MSDVDAWDERTSYLFAAIGAHTAIRFAELMSPYGLQPAHFGVLRRLAGDEGSTQQEVADGMRVRRSVMVGLVDVLEAQGLVERRRHPADRRANALHLTAAGRAVLTEVVALSSALDAELIAPVPQEARAAFREHLHRIGAATGVTDGVYPTRDTDEPALHLTSPQTTS